MWTVELARANVATSGVADRIELREQSVQDVSDRDVFNLIWLPTVFIPGEIVAAVLASLRPTLAPGGVLMVAITKIPDDKVGAAVARLRAVRAGGYPWSADEIAKRLRELDYGDVEILPSGTHSQRIIGRRIF